MPSVTFFSSTNKNDYYIYCKKIKGLDDYTDARRPLFTETASVYYYGTLINGVSFDGNFSGYGAADQGFLDKMMREGTYGFRFAQRVCHQRQPYQWLARSFGIHVCGRTLDGLHPLAKCVWLEQHGQHSGYSALAFDIRLEDVVDDED